MTLELILEIITPSLTVAFAYYLIRRSDKELHSRIDDDEKCIGEILKDKDKEIEELKIKISDLEKIVSGSDYDALHHKR